MCHLCGKLPLLYSIMGHESPVGVISSQTALLSLEKTKKVLTVLICYLAISLRELNVIPVLITFGNTYGLLMVSVLLGYGLVALPRSLWRQAKPDLELRRTYIMAVAADEALYEAVWDLQVRSFHDVLV